MLQRSVFLVWRRRCAGADRAPQHYLDSVLFMRNEPNAVRGQYDTTGSIIRDLMLIPVTGASTVSAGADIQKLARRCCPSGCQGPTQELLALRSCELGLQPV